MLKESIPISVETSYKKFCNLLDEERSRYLVYRVIYTDANNHNIVSNTKHTKPYWDDEVLELWKNMKTKEKLFTKCKNSCEQRSKLRQDFFIARREFDKTLRQKERIYYKTQMENMENMCKNNPNQFWNEIQKLGPKRKNRIKNTLGVRIEGEISYDKNIIQRKWFQDYEKLYSGPPGHIQNANSKFALNIIARIENRELQMLQPNYEQNLMLNDIISFDEIEKATKRSKKNKAVGIDNVPNEMLSSHFVMMYLYYLFNYCFHSYTVPSDWTKAILTPVPKAGKDHLEPLNHRGISILSCVGKLYSSILNNRIINYCDILELLVPEQNGFRKKRSCQDHIFTVTTIVRNRLGNGHDTYVALIDMEKAFDWVNRIFLLYKLLEANIDGNIYRSVKALYTNIQAYVKVNNTLRTDWFNVPSGVRQGDPLSSTLFSIFINDLVQYLKLTGIGIQVDELSINALLYADDIILMAKSEPELQILISALETWCNTWQMQVNVAKTNIIHFRHCRKARTNYQFRINNKSIEIVSIYKYLGFYLHEFMNYNKHAEKMADSGSRALGSIIGKFKTFKNVTFDSFTKLYESCVTSILDYASEVWGCCKAPSCNKIQQRAIRYYLGVHRFCPIPSLNGDIGWNTCLVRRKISMVRYWNRLIKMPDESITKKIFLWDYRQYNNNWCSEIENILDNVGLANLYETKSFCNIQSLQLKLRTEY